jgi:hypothetical protein
MVIYATKRNNFLSLALNFETVEKNAALKSIKQIEKYLGYS